MTLQEKILTLNTLAGTIDACVGAIRITKNSKMATESSNLNFLATKTAIEAVHKSTEIIKTLIL